MTEEIINSDGSRNWQANILLDNVKRLEQENKELKETIKQYCEWLDEERESNDKLQKVYQNDHCDLLNYRSALEEINLILDELKQQYDYMTDYSEIKEMQDKINEVLK